MLEDDSGKLGIVQCELMGTDERENIRPILIHFGAGGLMDGVKFERDHRLHSGGGDWREVGLGLFEQFKHLVIHKHEIKWWKWKS